MQSCLLQKKFRHHFREIFTAKIIVSGYRPHLQNIVIQLQNGDIKSSAAQVKYQKSGVFFFSYRP